ARGVALVGGRADHGVGADADPARVAGVGLGAGVAVVAGGARVDRVGADARCRVAGSGGVALVRRGAHDGVQAGAHAGLAGVGAEAEVRAGAGGVVLHVPHVDADGAARRARREPGVAGLARRRALHAGGARHARPALADHVAAAVRAVGGVRLLVVADDLPV